MNQEISNVLTKYPSLKYNEEKSKIVCSWTNHELPLNVDRLNEYINGNKYQRLLKAQKPSLFNVDDYKEFIVSNTHRKNKLFCKLTFRSLNNQIDHIRKHIEGRRFQRAYDLWKECKEKNEKFVSPYRRSKKDKIIEENDSDEKEFEDNLSDLYPDSNDDEMSVENGIEEDEDDQDDQVNGDDIENGDAMEEEEHADDNDDDDEDEEVKQVRQNMKRKFSTKITAHKKNEPKKKKNGLNGNKT